MLRTRARAPRVCIGVLVTRSSSGAGAKQLSCGVIIRGVTVELCVRGAVCFVCFYEMEKKKKDHNLRECVSVPDDVAARA